MTKSDSSLPLWLLSESLPSWSHPVLKISWSLIEDKMKIECSRALCPGQTDRQTEWLLGLLSESKISVHWKKSLWKIFDFRPNLLDLEVTTLWVMDTKMVAVLLSRLEEKRRSFHLSRKVDKRKLTSLSPDPRSSANPIEAWRQRIQTGFVFKIFSFSVILRVYITLSQVLINNQYSF